MLKIAVFAPTPKARESTATIVKPGFDRLRIYHNKSRGYKQYSFKTPYAYQNEHSQEHDQKSDRLKMSYVNAVSKERFTEYKYKQVKRKNKELKRQNEALQAEIKELKESGGNNSMLSSLGGVLAPILADKFPKAASALNGLENKEVMDIMTMLQQKLTEELGSRDPGRMV